MFSKFNPDSDYLITKLIWRTGVVKSSELVADNDLRSDWQRDPCPGLLGQRSRLRHRPQISLDSGIFLERPILLLDS